MNDRGHTESKPVSIRVAKPADGEQLAQLCLQLGYAATPPQLQQRLATILPHPDHQVYVAQHQNRVVGWVHGHQCEPLIAPTLVVILGLVVDETIRGKGIGRQLLQQIEAWAVAQSCSAVIVRSNVIRQAAHRFYENMGYQIIKQSMVFQKDL
jgi:GNAT superfamily N-acetyltransferase